MIILNLQRKISKNNPNAAIPNGGVITSREFINMLNGKNDESEEKDKEYESDEIED